MKQGYDVNERPPFWIALPLSIQHLFAMFGASVLVPMIFHLNPAIVLLMNGIGTLLFIFITKGKAPAYLGSSFAFITPTLLLLTKYPDLGYRMALGGFVISGLVFCLAAFLIKLFGVKWIEFVLPNAALGPVIALIGLELANEAAKKAGIVLDPSNGYNEINYKFVVVFLVTLGTATIGSVVFRKFLGVIPILIAIIVGYFTGYLLGIAKTELIQQASLFSKPQFQTPMFNLNAIIIILPASLVVLSEHIGHQMLTSKIIGKDLIKDPGLHRSLLGDGLSTALSGMVGSVPTTTYGENIGVMAITKVYSVWVIGGAAVLSILVSFIGVFSAAIQSIPDAVVGGVSFLLYGMIATSGIRLLVDSKVDYSRSRNLVLTSVVFITGLSGAAIKIGGVELKGMALATIVAMAMSLIFHVLDGFGWTNDQGTMND